MNNKKTTQQKRCLFCGRFFCPKKQVGDRQISCLRPECQKKRCQAQQKNWRKTNPGYFKGRYEHTKEWRRANPGYQKRWRAKNTARRVDEIQTLVSDVSLITTIRLNTRANIDFGEIQTLVLSLIKSGCVFRTLVPTHSGILSPPIPVTRPHPFRRLVPT